MWHCALLGFLGSLKQHFLALKSCPGFGGAATVFEVRQPFPLLRRAGVGERRVYRLLHSVVLLDFLVGGGREAVLQVASC